MKPAPFSYASPDTVEETLGLLADTGAEGRILAGGQTLGAMLNMRIVTPSLLIDINRVTDFPASSCDEHAAIMSALHRQGDALCDAALIDAVPLLAKVMPFVGHYQTRSRGTVCGSIAHADPTAELPLALLTLDGTIHLASASNTRAIAAKDFFLGPLTTDRHADELITKVEWPRRKPGQRFAFREVGAHNSHSALCGCAIAAVIDDSGIVREMTVGVTAISDRPLTLDVWAFLNAKPDRNWRKEVAHSAHKAFSYASDLHASADYRRHLSGVLILRCLEDIVDGQERSRGAV